MVFYPLRLNPVHSGARLVRRGKARNLRSWTRRTLTLWPVLFLVEVRRYSLRFSLNSKKAINLPLDNFMLKHDFTHCNA